jgi:general secretion pathway protein E/type IV pilus assembly protein PilB
MKTGKIVLTDKEYKGYFSADVAWHYRIVPNKLENGCLELFIDRNLVKSDTKDELEALLSKSVFLIESDSNAIEEALSAYYIRNSEQSKNYPKLEATGKDFVNELILEAKRLNSSDIHIEIYEQKCRIRFRIDGKLVERIQLRKTEFPSLINKIKILANLDISEKRLPQDGRIFFQAGDIKFDIRVSILPTLYGEKIVLRILGNSLSDVELHSLGFSETDLIRYKESIRKPNGIILVSGPTGSGKTTTLYATLRLLNKDTDNVLTVEDPIEYTLEGVNQVQIKEDIGLTFSQALRTFLRQDPDVIMVGEIRDVETANLAIRAALTGHLVLSTIHTNSAWGTISRLTDMGIPPFLISNTLNATLAQRLVRVLCVHCKQKMPVSIQVFPVNFKKKDFISEHFVAKGCPECHFTGYKGRKAIYEMIPIDPQTSELIVNSSSHSEVDLYFKSLGIQTLQQSAMDVVKRGETSIDEIYPLLLNEQY